MIFSFMSKKSFKLYFTNSFDFGSKFTCPFLDGNMFGLLSVTPSLFKALFLDFTLLTVALNKFVRSAMLEFRGVKNACCKTHLL